MSPIYQRIYQILINQKKNILLIKPLLSRSYSTMGNSQTQPALNQIKRDVNAFTQSQITIANLLGDVATRLQNVEQSQQATLKSLRNVKQSQQVTLATLQNLQNSSQATSLAINAILNRLGVTNGE